MVTIVIPFYDEIHYLEEAIASVLDQDLEAFEILAVCNQAILPAEINFKETVFRHVSIRWLCESTKGSAFARNKGLREAKGDWVQFLDVDDLILKHKISTQLNYPGADAIVSPHTYKFLTSKLTPSAWAPNDIWVGLLSSQIGSTSSMLWRRSALECVGGWNTEYYSNQEYELLFRLLKAGFSVQDCPENLTIVRERVSGSITKTTMGKPKAGIRLREQMWTYLVEKGLSSTERFEAFQKFVFKNTRALYITEPVVARSIHVRYFKGTSFRPKIGSVRLYGIFYGLLGFDLTERLMSLYRYIRDNFIKSLPSNT